MLRYLTWCLVGVALLITGGCHSNRRAASTAIESTRVVTPVIGSGQVVPSDGDHRLMGDGKLLVDEAMTWIGTPYQFGGKEKHKGTDCSGMTMVVYDTVLGVKIPRNSAEQQRYCEPVGRGDIAVGDLVFFATGRDRSVVSHVGMYIGNGQFIHASGSKGVMVSSLGEQYFVARYHSSGHVGRATDKPKVSPLEILRPITTAQDESLSKALNSAIENRIDSIYSAFFE